MAVESALIFLRALSQGRAIAPITLIAGPQAFLREYALESLHRTLANSGFNYRALQIGAGDSYGSLVNELEGDDLFAKKRLVAARILRSYRGRGGADDSTSDGPARGKDSAGEDAVVAALGRIGTSLRLALVYERDSAPAKVRRAVESSGTAVNCMRPFENQIAQYAEVFARFLGLKLSRQAADLLAARHGSDLGAIANALDKAAINQPKEGRIESAEFAAPGPSHAPDLFEIAESLAAGNPAQCLALFDRAMQVGRDPIEVLAVELIPQLRRMLTAAALLARKKNPGEVAAAIGVAPSSPLAARSIEGARRFGVNRLQLAHRQACELDAAFKMGLRKDREQAVAAMILELTTSG